MMSLVQIASWPLGKNTTAVYIRTTTASSTIEQSDLLLLDTPQKVQDKIETDIGALEPIFIHKNRDNTLAIAYGAEPDRWPEDETILGMPKS